jgi:hypothetical protein
VSGACSTHGRDEWVKKIPSIRLRFVAFPATEYDEVSSGYQPSQMVEWWENQTSTLRTRTEVVFETLVFPPLNQLTRLIARGHFIIVGKIFEWILENVSAKLWSGFIWPRIGSRGELLWTRWWTFAFHKRRGISWLAEWLLASQEGPCFTEFVN